VDVLAQNNISPTLRYISEFKREIGRLRTVMPKVWGMHNYSDVNRLQSWRTRALGRALGGQVWLTETGGIVQFGGAFPNRRGSGLKRASRGRCTQGTRRPSSSSNYLDARGHQGERTPPQPTIALAGVASVCAPLSLALASHDARARRLKVRARWRCRRRDTTPRVARRHS